MPCSYELRNMVFATSHLVNCVQLTSQLVNTTCELEIFYAGPYSPLVEKMVQNGQRLQGEVL